MRTVTIEVTQDDIDNGVQDDRCECPVAMAMTRMFRGKKVTVWWEHVTIGISPSFDLPEEVSEFIIAFDKVTDRNELDPDELKLVSSPFSFNIEVDDYVD